MEPAFERGIKIEPTATGLMIIIELDKPTQDKLDKYVAQRNIQLVEYIIELLKK